MSTDREVHGFECGVKILADREQNREERGVKKGGLGVRNGDQNSPNHFGCMWKRKKMKEARGTQI